MGTRIDRKELRITNKDLVIVRPRRAKIDLTPSIKIPDWADEKARDIAHGLGWDFYALREKWLAFATEESAKGNPPKNAGAAFVAYCKKQDKLR